MDRQTTGVPDLLTGFPPAVSKHTHTLILGSFPGKASLALSQYYGHPKNHFWRLMDWLFEPVHWEDPYDQRLDALLSCGVGIWDVYHSCYRNSSMDVDIRHAVFNDFSCLKDLAPMLTQVVFNGQTAAKGLKRIAAYGYRTCVLPSTSPAYTIPIMQKFNRWKAAILAISSVRSEV